MTFSRPIRALARLRQGALVAALALATLPALAPKAAAQCTVEGPGLIGCGQNGATNSQVFSPGSRIIRPQELAQFIEERQEGEGRSAVAVARAFRSGTGPLVFSSQSGTPGSGINVFTEELLSWEDQDETDNEIALDTDRRLGTVGIGWSTALYSVAAAIDFLDEDTDFDGGSSERNEIGLKVSGTVDLGNSFFVFGGARIAAIDVDTRRRTEFINISEGFFDEPELTGRGDTDGNLYALALGAGHVAAVGDGWVIGTGASLTYQREEIDGFTERFRSINRDSFTFEDQERESLLSRLEIEVARPFVASGTIYVPSLQAAYLHEFEDDARDIDVTASSFVNAFQGPETVSLRTNDPDRDYLSVGFGIEARPTSGNWTVSADYGALVGHDFLDQHTLAASARWRF